MKRIDFYTKVHKGLRASLFGLSQRAAAVDYADPTAKQGLAAELHGLLARLAAHAAHEARFIHPLLLEKTGESPFDAEHAALELEQETLSQALNEAITATRDQCEAHGRAFYRSLNRFISRYLEHLESEEATMPLLQERCSDEELAKVLARFGASRGLEETVADMRWMLPALSAAEQTELIAAYRPV